MTQIDLVVDKITGAQQVIKFKDRGIAKIIFLVNIKIIKKF